MANPPYHNIKFKYQLTRWYKNRESLKFAVDSIEFYYPNGEGRAYVYKRNNKTRKYAIFTDGKTVREDDGMEVMRGFGFFTPYGKFRRSKKREGISIFKELFR